jgi:hypothetical protein
VTPHYTLMSCNGHTWIERPSGLCRICGPYSYYDQTGKVVEELNVLVDRINHLESALRRIANTDYRGNRSTESQIAFEALKECK